MSFATTPSTAFEGSLAATGVLVARAVEWVPEAVVGVNIASGKPHLVVVVICKPPCL